MMKTISVPIEGLTLERLLQQAKNGDVVFLTNKGEIEYALIPADDGDNEVLATRANQDLMAYLTECRERAQTGPRKSLDEIRQLYGHA